ncbi:AsmA family protein [Hylemonella gracilis]|uniref:AsmA family protein n=1 Tax=Hylemonella gracilis ATCC 19624 TaxID=887062 RepID=F3KT43_9BURK|nr:AsmA family protein [Hylemonella gracilis]EGI77039.1 AsmA family protein [Hylemonella gracilis ATCC 19624]
MTENANKPLPPAASSSRGGSRVLRKLLGALLMLGLALVLVLMAGLAWIAARFDPQTQARQLAEQIRGQTGYQLTAAVPKLTVAPRLGLAWGPLSLQSAGEELSAGAPARSVATAQGMHLSLDLLDLLRGEVQVRRARIDGLHLWPAPDRHYVVPTLELKLAQLAATGLASAVGPNGLATPSSPSAPSSPSSPVTASLTRAATLPTQAVQATGTAVADPRLAPPLTHALELHATVLDAAGQSRPLKLQGQVGLETPEASAHGAASRQPRAFHVLLQGALDQTTFALEASRTDASAVLRFDLNLGTLDLDHYQAHPLAQPLPLTVASPADKSTPTASHPPDTSMPHTTGMPAADRVVAPNTNLGAPARASGTAPLLRWVHDLGLDELDLQGTLRVASLRFMNLQINHLRLQAQAQDLPLQESQGRKRRRIELNPLTASLYDGGVHGSLRIHLDDEAAETPRALPATTFIATKLDLRDVRIGPLLRDGLGIHWLEGRGNIALDLRSGGTSPGAYTRHLNGSVGLQLQNGSIGLNIADVLRAGLGQLGAMSSARRAATSTLPAAPRNEAASSEAASSPWRTPFERLRVSFQIEDGIARSQDLNLQAPPLRAGGAGTAWLAEQRLDYTLRVTLAPAALQSDQDTTLQSLDSLRGLTVPVTLQGPYDGLQWRIAYADIAPTRQMRLQLRGWAQDTLDTLRGLLPPAKKD